ncbi:hypothetical protein PM082_024989 [Marasmius tenuissimus]|nr:hypothetical protein PM082_024989 [Marasmius tenuissimus]
MYCKTMLTYLIPLCLLFQQLRVCFGTELFAELPLTITVSQAIDVSWSRESTEPFEIKLSYLDPEWRTYNAQPITTYVPGSPGADKNLQHGTVVVEAMLPGSMEFLAMRPVVPIDGRTYILTMFSTSMTAVPSTTSSACSSISSCISLNDFDQDMNTATNSETPPITKRSDNPVTLVYVIKHGHVPDICTSTTGSLGSSPSSDETTGLDSSTKFQPAGAKKTKFIIGSVIGAVLFVLLVLSGVVFVVRRQKRRGQPREGLRWDMMTLDTGETVASAMSPRGRKGPGEAEGTSKHMEVKSISLTTPLQERFVGNDNDRNSVFTSSSFRTSTGASTLAASVVSGESKSSSKGGISPLSPGSIPRARTDRQMQIEQKVLELQGRFIASDVPKADKDRTRAELQERIQKVEDLRESEWAYGEEGKIPDVLID